jgi:hypothetical protein
VADADTCAADTCAGYLCRVTVDTVEGEACSPGAHPGARHKHRPGYASLGDAQALNPKQRAAETRCVGASGAGRSPEPYTVSGLCLNPKLSLSLSLSPYTVSGLCLNPKLSLSLFLSLSLSLSPYTVSGRCLYPCGARHKHRPGYAGADADTCAKCRPAAHCAGRPLTVPAGRSLCRPAAHRSRAVCVALLRCHHHRAVGGGLPEEREKSEQS